MSNFRQRESVGQSPSDPGDLQACSSDFIRLLHKELGSDLVYRDPAMLRKYASDKTEELVYPPAVIVKPRHTQDLSRLLKLANRHRVPVFVRGRGTGLAGSSLATRSGICLSMERFDRILKLDLENLQLWVEPYVLNYDIQVAAENVGLFYPPDPASYRICSIGGNIAMNSSGPKAVKYGGTRNYVLGMEIVLPDGTVMQIGSRSLKSTSGYSLTQLIIGSEGTLAVVTKLFLRLIPLPKHNSLLLLTFRELKTACAAVHGILIDGIVPCGLELMERKALQCAKDYNNVNFPPLSEGIAAHLLIELDGDKPEQLELERERVIGLAKNKYNAAEVFPADDEAEKKAIWALRRSVYTGIKAHKIIKEMDFCVPIAALPEMIEEMERIGREAGFSGAAYGHAGDGNLHVGIIPTRDSQGRQIKSDAEITEGVRRIFEFACSLGGVISGEHGIGLVQKPYLPLLYDEAQLALMRSIKKAFDPNGILNPDKIFQSARS